MLADADIADEVVGFHFQQAAEKLFKAVLAAHVVVYRKTHDLGELADLLSDAGHPLPDALSELDVWTPFAVEARYDFLASTSAPLDRPAARELLRQLRAWAEAGVRAG